MGLELKSLRHGLASNRAQKLDLLRRALSVEIPVPAYICRYSLEIKTNASRDLKLGVQLDRCQIDLKL
jgi:hypothetical protein